MSAEAAPIDLLVLSSVPWHFTWQRHHEVSTRLAERGYRVTYFEPIPKRWPSVGDWLLVIYTVAFPSLLSQIFFVRGVELIGPNRASAFMNLVPIFGAIMSVMILGEMFRSYHLIALVMVLGGIALAERFAHR